LILVALQLLFTYAPAMRQVLRTTLLDARSWSQIVLLGMTQYLVLETEQWILRRIGVRSL
jgi:hypothetical protein